MDIRACIRCGSDDLRMPGVRDGVIVGYGGELERSTCNRCGLTAVALLFDDEAARLAYEADKARHPSQDWPPPGWPALNRP